MKIMEFCLNQTSEEFSLLLINIVKKGNSKSINKNNDIIIYQFKLGFNVWATSNYVGSVKIQKLTKSQGKYQFRNVKSLPLSML